MLRADAAAPGRVSFERRLIHAISDGVARNPTPPDSRVFFCQRAPYADPSRAEMGWPTGASSIYQGNQYS